MITLVGPLIEENIAKAARYYIHEHCDRDECTAEVPFIHNGSRRNVEFLWLAEQWIFIGLSENLVAD